MNIKNSITIIKERLKTIDWKLLIFLLLFLNVKLIVKLAAVIFIYALRHDLRFKFQWNNSRLPLFYILIIGIGILTWLVNGNFTNGNYNLVVLTGIIFWAFSILAIHQVRSAIEKNEPSVIHRTLLLFFIINAVISLVTYLGIIIETGHLNPYRYQGDFQKYFIGTGDHIKGVTLDTSTTNAIINSFFIIYFLYRNNNLLVLPAMMVLLLTGSNIINLILCATLVFAFCFQSNRSQKSIIVVCMIMLIVFLAKVSPQNNSYVTGAWKRITAMNKRANIVAAPVLRITARPDSTLTIVEKREKIAQLYLDSMNREMLNVGQNTAPVELLSKPSISFIAKPVIPEDSIHTPQFQHKNDTTEIEKDLIKFIEERPAVLTMAAARKIHPALPGKLIALKQTIKYFQARPQQMVIGTGIGNFSSKLAFRATSMKIAGGYPQKLAYINKAFEYNHLDLYLYYFTNKDDLHSMANNPNSTYDQLISEYGVAGLSVFVIFYLGFFMGKVQKKSYALPLILFMTAAFFMEYWFEQLSVVVLFELLLLLNIKETTQKEIDESK